MTRAIALRMIHAGEVAASPAELEAWIARTDDLRERLLKGGYGAAFTAEDLFPLFQSFVAKASAGAPRRAEKPRAKWPWIVIVVAIVAIIGVVVALGLRLTSG